MRPETACVYMIGVVGLQAVKIGWAGNPVARLGDLQVGCPLPLVLLYQFPTCRPVAVESALHQRFADKRLRGEWFELGPDGARIAREACEEIAAGLPPAPVAAEARQAALTPSEFFLADIHPWIMDLPESVEYVTTDELCCQLRATANPFWQDRGPRMLDFPLGYLFEEDFDGKKVRAALIRQAADYQRKVRAQVDPRVGAYYLDNAGMSA